MHDADVSASELEDLAPLAVLLLHLKVGSPGDAPMWVISAMPNSDMPLHLVAVV